MAIQHASSSTGVARASTEEETSPLLATGIETVGVHGIGQHQSDVEFGGTEAREKLEKKLLRKLDTRMSILVLIYILNYIDRNNASAARLHGFEEDLGLHGTQFSTILSILYCGYILMQIPSNMFLNVMGKPSLYLSICMAIWGVLSFATGYATSFYQVLFTRFFLGFVEAAFFPGALFLISKWYKRRELSQRTAMLSVGSLISNATGSLIASGILAGTDGVWGYAAWRWLFFIEGGLTVFVALCAIFILPDFPETPSGWLTPEEQALAIKRMAEDTGKLAKHNGSNSNWIEGFYLAISDWKVWWLAATLTFLVFSLSFNAYFPTLVGTIGYDSSFTLLLCVPPWVFATLAAVLLSRHSDQSEERCRHVTFSFGLGIVGFFLGMLSSNGVIRYCSFCLMAQSYAGYICLLAWASGSISQPPAKGAVALALINTVSSFGNIFGSYAWPSSWGTSYNRSFAVSILASVIGLAMCWYFRRQLILLNAKDGGRGSQYML